MNKVRQLEFKTALVSKVTNTPDGGAKITFEVDGGQVEGVAVLLMLACQGKAVSLIVKPE